MILSNGNLKGVSWSGSIANWPGWNLGGSVELSGRWSSYAELYRQQLWVTVVVNKIANAAARLPLKVYRREDDNDRVEDREHPYARLLRRPNPKHDPYFFWLWTVSTLGVYGESLWGKVRDRGGRPVELWPVHPTNLVEVDDSGGRSRYVLQVGSQRQSFDEADIVHFRFYNPDTTARGMSPLEPLRRTLENEDASRRASSAFWSNGGRPSMILEHPGNLSEPAVMRLRAQVEERHRGVDNWARPMILEEAMKATLLPLNAEEMQYIESRKLNREEVCGAYDVPPPVVHILDHATYSNITEQMRSMYRDTMAPKLGLLESVLEMQLRGSVRAGGSEPDFGEGVYAEFLMDEVLRGAFEQRAEAYQKAINAGWMMPAEVRRAENLPFVEGSDVLMVNSTLVPIDLTDDLTPGTPTEGVEPEMSLLDRVNAVAALIRAGFEPGPSAAAVGLPDVPHTGLVPITVKPEEDAPAPRNNSSVVRTVMGRLSRQKTLDEVDIEHLTAGLNGHGEPVRALYERAIRAGMDMAEFRSRLRALLAEV